MTNDHRPIVKWRYFRIDGNRPTYCFDGNFTIQLHHGGRLCQLGTTRTYSGGEIGYVDGQDPDFFSWVCLNHFAEDLGYREPPITYWFNAPGRNEMICLDTDERVQEMLTYVAEGYKVLQIFMVALCERKKREAELEDINKAVNCVMHSKYYDNRTEDIVEEEVATRKGKEKVIDNQSIQKKGQQKRKASDNKKKIAAGAGTSEPQPSLPRKKRTAGRIKTRKETSLHIVIRINDLYISHFLDYRI